MRHFTAFPALSSPVADKGRFGSLAGFPFILAVRRFSARGGRFRAYILGRKPLIQNTLVVSDSCHGPAARGAYLVNRDFTTDQPAAARTTEPSAADRHRLFLFVWSSSGMVFVLDNYDSFTYNLVQYLGELGAEVEVRRNDQMSVDEIEALRPERIVISPGPCTPQEAGISIDLIRHFAGKVPLLGVCLGHQAIGAAFGGQVVRAKNLMHGKTSQVEHDGKTIFRGLPTPMTATRYHSLIVEEKDLPAELEVSAWTTEKDGSRTIMGLRHKKFAVEGVQFHPESVLTDAGKKLVENFLTTSH